MGFRSKKKKRMANSVDPDEMAHYEPSHLDLHCLHRYVWSVKLKGLKDTDHITVYVSEHKTNGGVADNIDPAQTDLIRIYTVCLRDLVPIKQELL